MTEMKKLKGSVLRLSTGEITLKEIVKEENHQFDQIYFKTNDNNILVKVYDLEKAVSITRFENQIAQYRVRVIPMIHKNVHYEKITVKKRVYGIITFSGIKQENSLKQLLFKMDEIQIQQLSLTFLENLVILMENKLFYANFRPQNIYKVNQNYVIINAEYVSQNSQLNLLDQFLLEVIEKNWEYWAPQTLDSYSKETLNYRVDMFAIGCILYQTLMGGVYPFESKLTAQTTFYRKIQNKGELGNFVNKLLNSATQRSKVNIFEEMKMIQRELNSKKGKKQNLMYHLRSEEDRKVKKEIINSSSSSNIKFLDNISTVFSKMMNDSEGFYLNYVEDTPKVPQNKFLDNILIKLYRSEEKAEKLNNIIIKYISANEQKLWSIHKTLLLIWQIFRKGPSKSVKVFLSSLQKIQKTFKGDEYVQSLCEIIIEKEKLHEKIKKCLAGNFFLSQISHFKELNTDDLNSMMDYLQKLVQYVNKKIKQRNENIGIQKAIIEVACDDMFDLISMVIFSVICLRKDNNLGLRKDKLNELSPLEKKLNISLKTISDLSNFVGGHAIYSLQREYIAYQEEILLRINPYYTVFQHFYRSSRNYKGLLIPQNFQATFKAKPESKQQKNQQQQPNQENLNKDYFAGEEVESDEEPDHHEPFFSNLVAQSYFNRSKMSPTKNSILQQFCNIKNSPKKKIEEKQSKRKSYQITNKIKFPSKAPQKSSKTIKNDTKNSISFAQFGNIESSKNCKTETDCKMDQFNLFFDFNVKDQNKQNIPPLPAQTKTKQKNKNKNEKEVKFDEFSLFLDVNNNKKKQTENNNKSLLDLDDFIEIKQKAETNNSYVMNSFDNFHRNLIKEEPKYNPLLEKILEGLKLKELKDLLRSNEKFVKDFDNFKIIRKIGSGAAGQVYLGTYNQQSVAIKKVKTKQNPNALKQFERQLVTCIKIGKNPHLVSLVGISQSNEDFFLVTEFCSSGSLFDLLHKRKHDIVLTWEDRLRFAIEIAEGMLALHQMKPVIIHRDLKSLNVFVSQENGKFVMKVADFGLSRSLEAELMTTQLGTIHWMAPQLLEGIQYSFKVDVYSYGILLWEILTRNTPYSNLQNVMGIMKYVAIDKKRPEIQQISSQCPKRLINVMRKCWQHEANNRPNFNQILQELKKITI